MSNEYTPNLKLPLLVPNQSGKEVTHNEALIIIDALLNNGVIDKDLSEPPSSVNFGDMYIVAVNSTKEWEDYDKSIAFFNNGWRFIIPKEGLRVWVNDENCLYVFSGSDWIKFFGGDSTSTLQNVSFLGINTDADSENKLAVASNYILFDKSVDNIRVKTNKNNEQDVASHLFQTNYSSRAELGLIGNDNLTLKVSNDGENWKESFVVDKDTGDIDFKKSVTINGSSLSNNNTSNSANEVINSNLLINGNFDIWQRNVSFTNIITGDYTADRWKVSFDGIGANNTVSRQSFIVGQIKVPNNPKYYYRWENSIAGNNETYKIVEQRIEGVEKLSGQNATVSFYAKSDLSRTQSVYFMQNFGIEGSEEVVLASKNIEVTDVWQKFVLTFTIPSISGKIVGNSSYLSFRINLPINTSFVFDLSQVKVEKGNKVTDFIERSIGEELILCQRYYEKSYNQNHFPGLNVSTSGMTWVSAISVVYTTGAKFKFTKRKMPSVTLYSRKGKSSCVSDYLYGQNIGTKIFAVGVSDSGFIGCCGTENPFYLNNVYEFHYIADAEL